MMRNSFRRRDALRVGAVQALMLCAGGAALTPHGALSATAPKLPLPSRPMRLSRTLTRDLRGGDCLRVARDWRIEFAEQGQGVAITGWQLAAHVDAPPALAQLAEIEERRETGAMFPILLSGGGIILAAGASTNQDDVNDAVLKAKAMIADMAVPDSEKAQHQLFLAQLQRGSASLLDQMPPDLFYPSGKPVRSVREIDLPAGLTGEFELNYEAFTSAGQAWLQRAIREVVTRIGDEERRSTEEWTLEPLETQSR